MLCVIGEEDVGLFVCDDVDVIAVVDVVVANQENEFLFLGSRIVSFVSFFTRIDARLVRKRLGLEVWWNIIVILTHINLSIFLATDLQTGHG